MSAERGWVPLPRPAERGELDAVLAAASQASPESSLQIDVDPISQAPILGGTAPEWGQVISAGHAAAAAWRRLRSDPASDVVVDLDGPDAQEARGSEHGAPRPGAVQPLVVQPPAARVCPEASAAARLGAREPAAHDPAAGEPATDGEPRAGLPVPPSSADAVVIGGGIIGLAVAEALGREGQAVVVLEASGSLGSGTTHWNNGMVHPGHDPHPGTLKAALNVAGNAAWGALARRIGLPFHRSGSLVVAHHEGEAQKLGDLLARATANGVPGVAVVDGAAARAMEPRLNRDIIAALSTPSTAMIDAVEATRALAVAVRALGGEVFLSCPVTAIDVAGGEVYGVSSPAGHIAAPLVVNAAGIRADQLAATTGSRRYSLHARRGSLVLFDPGAADAYPLSVGPVPGAYSKGGGMTARPDGMTTCGPSAVEQRSRVALPPQEAELESLLAVGHRIYPDFPFGSAAALGSEVRPVTYSEDFMVSPAPAVRGLVDAAGTQSPGIASAPAIAASVVSQLRACGALPLPQRMRRH